MTGFPHDEADLDTMARTVYGEAERNDLADAVAIAWVIRNRAALPNWPGTIKAVCRQRKQFSCWNDPANVERLMQAADRWFEKCRAVSRDVLRGMTPDPTARATHYYATWIKEPRWARGHTPTYSTPAGKYTHLFYNDVDTPPPLAAQQTLDRAAPLARDPQVQAGAGGVLTGGAMTAQDAAQVADAVQQGHGFFADPANWIGMLLGLLVIGIGLWAILDRVRARRALAR